MHVAPDHLRAVSQDGLVIRFATLGSMAFVLAELPASGSAGTVLERPCERAHWGFVVDGDLAVVAGGRRTTIGAGHGFHIPAGAPAHRIQTTGSVLVAGLEPVEADIDLSDAQLVERGFELSDSPPAPTVVPVVPPYSVKPGEIRVDAWPMAGYVMSRVHMGERTGYTSAWCDAPHWGIVTSGRLVMEWENDVELVAKGDVFHCPAGPPGHRIEAADPVTFVDLTPSDAFADGTRLAGWRRDALRAARQPGPGIAVAALA